MSSRVGRVKNRAPAPIQITAEQILRESRDRQESVKLAPRREITDPDELRLFQLEKRKYFEDKIRMQRHHLGNWTKYADFEERQNEFERARSIYERALGVEGTSPKLWIRYVNMEMRHGFINRARNVWERCVAILPRHDQFWLKYAFMEEMAGNRGKARAIFERWMKWEPNPQAWFTFTKFEERGLKKATTPEAKAKALERARHVMNRYLGCHPSATAYIKVATWEEQKWNKASARAVWTRSLSELHDHEKTPDLYLKFAGFEERQNEVERARVIYKYALDHFGKQHSEVREESDAERTDQDGDDTANTANEEIMKRLREALIHFEKKYGDQKHVENAVLTKRRKKYEALVQASPFDYDAWFDYIRLEEAALEDLVSSSALSSRLQLRRKRRRVNDEYEEKKTKEEGDGARMNVEAASETPVPNNNNNNRIRLLPNLPKNAFDKTRSLYKRAVANVPPVAEKELWKRYIYLWIKMALFEELVAQGPPENTRRVYRECLKTIPHHLFTFGKIWVYFAKFELRQLNLAGARKILGRGMGKCPLKKSIYESYIELESSLGNIDRCRKIYAKFLENFAEQPSVWIAFATLEANVGEEKRCRQIYEACITELESDLEQPELVWKAYIDSEIGFANEKVENDMTESRTKNEDTVNSSKRHWTMEYSGAFTRVRALYERLLERVGHVKVWISFAKFEYDLVKALIEKYNTTINEETGNNADEANSSKEENNLSSNPVVSSSTLIADAVLDQMALVRSVLERAYQFFKRQGKKAASQSSSSSDENIQLKKHRLAILECWLDLEKQLLAVEEGGYINGITDSSNIQTVEKKLPKQLKKRKLVTDDSGREGKYFEEYIELIFPDDQVKPKGLRILEMAQKWKMGSS
eukprot:g1089.t1